LKSVGWISISSLLSC